MKTAPFTDADAAAAYRERAILIKDAIQLKKTPARSPACPSAGFFPVQYAGVSMYEAMYDYDILTQAWKKYCHDFTPDAYNAPTTIVPGKLLDIPDFKLCKWPGRGVSNFHEVLYKVATDSAVRNRPYKFCKANHATASHR